MTYSDDQALDNLLDAIRTHLSHQHGRPPTDAAVVAYIRRSTATDIYHDLRQYPACRATAHHLKGDGSHVFYVMLWGRVNDWTATDHSPTEDRNETQ